MYTAHALHGAGTREENVTAGSPVTTTAVHIYMYYVVATDANTRHRRGICLHIPHTCTDRITVEAESFSRGERTPDCTTGRRPSSQEQEQSREDSAAPPALGEEGV